MPFFTIGCGSDIDGPVRPKESDKFLKNDNHPLLREEGEKNIIAGANRRVKTEKRKRKKSQIVPPQEFEEIKWGKEIVGGKDFASSDPIIQSG